MLFLTFSHTTLPYLHICSIVSEPVIGIEDDAYKTTRAFYRERLAASFNLDNLFKPSDFTDATINLTHQTIALQEEANRDEVDLRALKSASEELHDGILGRMRKAMPGRKAYKQMIFRYHVPQNRPSSTILQRYSHTAGLGRGQTVC